MDPLQPRRDISAVTSHEHQTSLNTAAVKSREQTRSGSTNETSNSHRSAERPAMNPMGTYTVRHPDPRRTAIILSPFEISPRRTGILRLRHVADVRFWARLRTQKRSDKGIGTGHVGDIASDASQTPLKITRPLRGSKARRATSETPQSGLEITAALCVGAREDPRLLSVTGFPLASALGWQSSWLPTDPMAWPGPAVSAALDPVRGRFVRSLASRSADSCGLPGISANAIGPAVSRKRAPSRRPGAGFGGSASSAGPCGKR
jgi:hypothetical protein